MTKNIIIVFSFLALAGCQTTKEAMLDMSQATPEVRAMQTRMFDAEKSDVSKAVIQTLQDLNFEMQEVNSRVGMFRAVKHTMQGGVKVTVKIKKTDEKIKVRMSANFADKPVEEHVHYNSFFASLGKSVFLQENF